MAARFREGYAWRALATLSAVSDDGLNELVRQALRGDAFAVRQLMHAMAPVVRSICRGITGRQHPDIEDAFQDCLIDVVRAQPSSASRPTSPTT